MFGKINNEKGITLIIALMLMLMLTVIGVGIVVSTNDEITIAGNEYNEMRAFYAAESGLDKASAQIQVHYENTGIPPTTFPAETLTVDGITFGYSTAPDAPGQKTLVKGAYTGLKAYSQPYSIRSTAFDSSHSAAVGLRQSFEVAFIPIFQFAVFYENDLEIAPGTKMDLTGRVHSNSDIYIQSGSGLSVESYLTAHGDIHHGRKPESGLGVSNGDVLVKGVDGNYYSMKDGGGWLDSDDAYWYDSASVRWRGRVQDAGFGQDRLDLPLHDPAGDPHKIIERASSGGVNKDSFENKALFKIIDGQALSFVGGIWQDVTGPLVASGALVEQTFHDKRESKDVTVYDIDMGVFKASGYVPSNGIIYISDQRSGLRGARITNAENIGMPLTIASENPVYTIGNINTVDKVPMSIITDALTILSDGWSDDPVKAASINKSDRIATNTTANFCYISGNKETGAGGAGYNGGLENFPRFLEDWSGKKLTYRGSIINLWLSQMAVGDWSGSYYSPPDRDWAFDTDLNDPDNMPPGTPTVRAFIRWGWRQMDVGYLASQFGESEEN